MDNVVLMPEKPLRGTKVPLRGAELTFQSLTIAQLQELRDRIAIIDLGKPAWKWSDEEYDALISVLHTSIHHNHPEITLGDLKDMIDMHNWVAALAAAAGGLVRLPA